MKYAQFERCEYEMYFQADHILFCDLCKLLLCTIFLIIFLAVCVNGCNACSNWLCLDGEWDALLIQT